MWREYARRTNSNMKRTESREVLFFLLFCASFRKEPDPAEIIDCETEYGELTVDDYAKRCFAEILGKLDEIDQKIGSYLENRNVDRLSRVAHAALRIAFYEIENVEDVPDSVAINEAVNLVKKYDTQESAAYINGVLGTYVRGR